jgi:hypothetical protein
VHELLVFVPDSQHLAINQAILAMTANCNFSVTVHPESVLFSRPVAALSNAYPYALQMGVKLLAARLVRTHFYITLDADVVLLQPFRVSDLVEKSPLDGVSRAVYHNEDRAVHAHWWVGSQAFLNISSEEDSDKSTQGGFGVTPSILSTYGSLLTVDWIYSRHSGQNRVRLAQTTQQVEQAVMSDTQDTVYESQRDHLRMAAAESLWLDGFGREEGCLWSEYTLYRLVLDHYEVQ